MTVVARPRVVQAESFAVAAVLLVMAAVWFVFSYGYIEDDTFIHLEFARSVAEGHGFEFNGRLTNGDTAPLWVLILVVFHAIGLAWVASAKAACAGGLIVAVVATWKLANALAGDDARHRYLAPVATVLTLTNPYVVHWSFSGMEALAALGVSLAAIEAIFTGRPGWPRLIRGALLLAIGPLLRPELLLLAGIAGPVVLWRCWGLPRARFHLLRGSGIAVLMALPLALWSVYALSAFGSIVPNTNHAKQGAVGVGIAWRLLSVYAVGFPVTLAGLVVVVCGMKRPSIAGRLNAGEESRRLARAARRQEADERGRRLSGAAGRLGEGETRWSGAVWMLLLWPLACIGFYLANHTLVQTRYVVLSMPAATLALLWILGELNWRRLFRWTAMATMASSAAVIALIVVPHVSNKEVLRQSLSELSAFIRENVPANEPVAIFAIGQVAFESRHRLLDTGGITDPSVIPFLGNGDAVVEWAKRKGARYFVGDRPPQSDAERLFVAEAPFIGWSLKRSDYRTTRTLALYRIPDRVR